MLINKENRKLSSVSLIVAALSATPWSGVMASQDIVIQTLLKDYPSAVIEDVTQINRDGETLYEVDFEQGGKNYEAVYSNKGELRTIQAEDFSDSTLILGLFMRSENVQYLGAKRETNIYPFVWYENANFYIHGKSLGYTFYRSSGLTVAAQLDIGLGDGYEPDENKLVEDLPELDMPLNLGIVVEKEFGSYELETIIQYDVADAHGGLTASVGFGREFKLSNNWDVELGAELAYFDKNYTEYFYGVLPKYVTETRAAYTPKGTVNYGLEVSLRGRFGDNWHVIGGVEYMQLGSEIKDSPLIDASSEVEISVGIGYAF